MYFVLLIGCLLLNFCVRRPYKKIAYQISYILLFVFSALRYNFGNDYSSYQRYFNEVMMGVQDLEIEEFGFFLFNKIFPSYYLMIAVISGIFLYTLYKLTIQYLDVEEYKYSLLVFIIDPYSFLMSLSMIRQSLAIELFIIGLYFAKNKRYLLYIFLCIIAMSVHTSAIVLLPVLLIANDKKDFLTNPKWMIPIVVVLFIFSDTFLTPIIEWALMKFDDPNYYYYYETIETNTIRATILSSVPLIYIVINIGKLEKEKLMYSKLSLFAYFSDLFAFKYAMVGRIGAYFTFFKLIALPAVFVYNYHNCKGIDRIVNVWIFPSLIIVIYLLRLYAFFTNPMWQNFTVYRTILELW